MAGYRRRIFLINKPFQLRYAFYVCSWMAGLSLIYPLLIFNIFNYFSGLLAQDPYGPALQKISDTRTEIIWLLVLLQGLFLLITFLISVFISHRIAGPIYKLSLFIKKATDGQISENLLFRKDDHFQELAGEYNQMLGTFRKRAQSAQDAANLLDSTLKLGSGPDRADVEKALTLLRTSLPK